MTDWDQLWRDEPGAFHHFPSEDLVRWATSLGSGQRILEVGCGAGQNVRALWKLGHYGYGVDVSPSAIIHARQVNPGIAEYFQADVSWLPFDDGFFYGVADIQCLQHVEDLSLAYKEIYRVLRPGGQLFTMHLEDGMDAYPSLSFTSPSDRYITDAGLVITSKGTKTRTWDNERVSWRMRVCEKPGHTRTT